MKKAEGLHSELMSGGQRWLQRRLVRHLLVGRDLEDMLGKLTADGRLGQRGFANGICG
ncbi:hypothetical protein KFK09_001689 [Dendrobium nobile]|uniref:Uncharacterized protein n=1 Tax=Dendrobium nobile TaxID=94219 RepID=A0A8T3CBL3_DENNO|nr:hypothetical protein KFK09_001689 [Dendrobium nobile]